MNPFFTTVGNLAEVKPFADGNDKQRTHLNELVTKVNTISKEAQRTKSADQVLSTLENMTPTLVILLANGAATPVRIPMEVQPI